MQTDDLAEMIGFVITIAIALLGGFFGIYKLLSKRFTEMDNRFKEHEHRFDELDAKFVPKDICKLINSQRGVDMERLEKKFDKMDSKLDTLIERKVG